jgi:streptogramin lyase
VVVGAASTPVRRAVLAALVLVVVPAGCGDDQPPDEVATGPRALELADTFELAGNPEWLVDGFDRVWVHKDDGTVLGLDPGSGAVVQTLDTGYHELPACQGFGRDDTALWSCAGTDALVRLDPDAGTATRVAVAKRSDEGRLAFAGGLLWYLETGTHDLVGLDSRPAEAARVPLGEVCTDLAFDDDVVFALCTSTHHVIRVDPAARAVTGSIDVENPRNATVGTDLFVGAGGGMVQVDTGSLEVLHTYDDVGPGLVGNVDATADEVWVREEDDTFLTRIDPETHEVVATVDAEDHPSGGDVLITEDWVWATASDDDVVVRVAR